ncbi:MAG: hypothetical protein WBE27_02210, partial [Microgenomates group bacterium]
YFGSTEKTAFNALSDSVEKVINEFLDIWGDVEIAAAVIVDGVIYTACGGGAQAAVFRNGILAKILVSKKEDVVSASGHPKTDDIFLLGTSKVFTAISQGVIKAALEGSGLNEAIESLAPAAHAMPDSGNFGLVLVKFATRPVILGRPTGDKLPKKDKRLEDRQEPGLKYPKILSAAASPLSLISFQKIKETISSLIKGKAGERKIYVRGREEEFDVQKKKVTVSIGAILVVLLIVSIGFGIRQKLARDERSRYEDRLKQAQHEYDEAQGLFTLNPERARELFRNAKNLVIQMEEEGVEDPELEELVLLLKENEGQVLGEHTVEPDLYLDLSILTDGFKADKMVASEGRLFVLDKEGKRVVQIELETKRTEVAAGAEDVEEAKDVTAYSDRIFVLSEGGIYEVSDGRKKKVDNDWAGDVLVHAYAGNLYVLEKETSKVWRYAGIEDGFGSKQGWLAPSVEPDLTNIFSWAFDGSVWLLSTSGGVFKYTRGNQDSLDFSSVIPQLSRPSAVYTNEELDFVYLLEKERGRIVVAEKDGAYKSQYFSDKIREAKGLVVSEEVGKMIFLVGETLYSIEIRHGLD